MKGELLFLPNVSSLDFYGRYGQHLSKDEADALVAPHPDSIREVEEWLTFHGINLSDAVQRTDAGDWMTVRVSVAQAERMFGTKYNVYHHIVSSERVVRTMCYSLPRELHAHIVIAAPTTYFGTMRSMHATSFLRPQTKHVTDANTPSSCNSAITPACLQTLYNTINYVPSVTNINKLGVAGYLGEYANRNDLQVRECPGFAKALGLICLLDILQPIPT